MTLELIRIMLLSIAITLPFWVVVRVSQRRSEVRRRQPVSNRREALLGIFFLYLVVLAAITVVPRGISRSGAPGSESINLVPIIHSIRTFLPSRNAPPESIRFWIQNILGNILLFIPLGFLLPMISSRFDSVKRAMLVGFLLSVGIESIQFLSRFVHVHRSVDIDDVLLNTLGASIGYLCLAAIGRVGRVRPSRIRIVNARR
jgi:glycopeptide antibiotics resistance protein